MSCLVSVGSNGSGNKVCRSWNTDKQDIEAWACEMFTIKITFEKS